MAEAKFYRCAHCGNIVMMVDEQCPCVPHCCGEVMEPLVPGSVDAAAEKHVPVVTVDGHHVTVKVGEVAHPMTDAHYIQWVALVSDKRSCLRRLDPTDAPEVRFGLHGTEGATVYAYCNLHGLWKAEL